MKKQRYSDREDLVEHAAANIFKGEIPDLLVSTAASGYAWKTSINVSFDLSFVKTSMSSSFSHNTSQSASNGSLLDPEYILAANGNFSKTAEIIRNKFRAHSLSFLCSSSGHAFLANTSIAA